MKTCSTCKRNKDEKAFGRDKGTKDGLRSRCRSCDNERQYLKKRSDAERMRGGIDDLFNELNADPEFHSIAVMLSK